MNDTIILPKFEDIHAFSTTGYQFTNEEPEIFRKFISSKRIRKAACIASGGEIPLFVLLPKCRSVVAIDHSYYSLSAFVQKIILLQSVPHVELRKRLMENDKGWFKGVVEEVTKKLPPNLVAKPTNSNYPYFIPLDIYSLRREWLHVPEKVFIKAIENLGGLTLVHGDISDLSKYGPFDLLYISNAREHTNREHKNPTLTGLGGLLKDGGILLETGANNPKPVYPDGWKLTKSMLGIRTTWEHRMLSKGTAPNPAVEATK